MRLALLVFFASAAQAQVQRTFMTLPSSNGYGAVMADVSTAKVVHFRERLPATEEPQVDAAGADLFVGNQPQIIKTRDLLFDTYFGLRVAGQQKWLSSVPVETSGYEAGGTGMVTWKQTVSGLEVTTWMFAPRSLPHAGFVLVMRVKNPGAVAVAGVSAFSLHNFHLGFGRPGPMAKLAANGETVVVGANRDVLERAFAGVVATRPLGPVSHAGVERRISRDAERLSARADRNRRRLPRLGGRPRCGRRLGERVSVRPRIHRCVGRSVGGHRGRAPRRSFRRRAGAGVARQLRRVAWAEAAGRRRTRRVARVSKSPRGAARTLGRRAGRVPPVGGDADDGAGARA